MSATSAICFDRLILSPQFVDDLSRIEQDDPDGAAKIARSVCDLLRDMGSVDRRKIRSTQVKLFRTRPPGEYRCVDWPQGDGATALIRVLHRREVYRWASGYEGEPADRFLPVVASPPLAERITDAETSPEKKPTAVIPIPRHRWDDPVTVRGPDEIMAIVRKGMPEYLTVLSREQRELLNRLRRGPAVIRGPAGSGKTILALHLVRQLQREMRQGNLLRRDGRILLLNYGRTLRENLKSMLMYLYGTEIPRAIEVTNIHRWCETYLANRDSPWIAGMRSWDRTAASVGSIRNAIARAADSGALGNLDPDIVLEEIVDFIIPMHIRSLSEYLDADRTGRRFPLRPEARERIWEVYRYRQEQVKTFRGALGYDDLINLTVEEIERDRGFVPYRAVVIDEVQDFSVSMLHLAKKLCGDDESRLFLFGDAAQSVFAPSFHWKDSALTIRGGQVRSLSSSHRCTRRIFQAAQTLLHPLQRERPEDYDEPDQYSFDGDKPRVVFASDEESELLIVTDEIQSLLQEGISPQAIAVLAATNRELTQFQAKLADLDVPAEYFKDNVDSRIDFGIPAVKLVTIHSAKGFGFPHVFLLLKDPPDREWDDAAQRKLLFTAMTRAGISLTVLTPEEAPHPLMEEMVSSGHAIPEYPG
ncbi:MAG: AAA family ATPase [Bacillota bacterium]